jgi:hypothetical protein
MAKVGRPRKFSKKQVKELMCAFEEYIQNTEVPIINEFTYQQGIIRQNLYDYPEFSTLLKRCTEKKEVALEKGMLSGNMPPAAAIFSLKQMGWRDKHEVEHNGSMKISVIDDIKRNPPE